MQLLGSQVLAAQGIQGSWRLGQQEIQCFRKIWQPVLANTLQYSCLESPFPDREAWQATVYRAAKTLPKQPCAHGCKTSFACGSSVPLRLKHEGGAATWLVRTLKHARTQTASATGVMDLSSAQFSCSVVSNSLRPHESQHATPPCPSPTPRVHSDSRPLS